MWADSNKAKHGNRMHVLIVDDSPGTRHAFRVGLTSQGFQVDTAASGSEALQVLSKFLDSGEIPDVLITDLRMPLMNGLELIRTARKWLPELPAILMTAYGDETIKQNVAQLSRCNYLDKPFTAGELVRMIHAMLLSQRGPSPARIEKGEGDDAKTAHIGH